MTQDNFDMARKNMVLGQLVPHRICDSNLLEALQFVPKENFLPERLQSCAYADRGLIIKEKTILFEPFVFASLLQLANVKKTDFVLNLKAGTGYCATVLGRLAQAVVALEVDSILSSFAQEKLIEMNVDNVAVINQNPDLGFPKQAPFDVIFIEGVIPYVPEQIEAQLAQNGNLIAVIADPFDTKGRATKVTKQNGVFSYTVVFEVDLIDFNLAQNYKKFVFETVS